MLLTLDRISKTYGDTQVLNQVSLTLDTGQKTGLVGANGVGKSTLLKIVVGEESADGGAVQLHGEVGYLPQVLATSDALTIEALLDAALGGLRLLEADLHRLERQMAEAGGQLESLLADYGRARDLFEHRGGYDAGARVEQMLAGLGVAHLERSRRLATLSGGEKARIGLTALLLRQPDLLLLDEPTNHLDFAALEWLEGYLKAFRGGLLVVSHDRDFLNETVTAIVEIDEPSREAKHYGGNYDFYAQVKVQERAKWIDAYWAQQEEIHALRRAIKGKARQVAHNRAPKDGDKFLIGFKAGRLDNAISRNVHAAEEKLRRIEENPIPRPPRPLRISPDFDPLAMVSRSPLTVDGVGKAYAGRPVLDDVSFTLSPDARAVLIGPNGAGKSTLLRIMAGLEPPDCGSVTLSPSVVLGYLDQEQDTLAAHGTVYTAFRGERLGGWEELKAELLGYGLFTYDELLRPVAALSVGQKRKLQIAQLIAAKANLLLLDEPTNHVSLDVLEEFEQALMDFPGPVIAVAHDRRFIRRFATEIWELADGRLRRYLGGWERYREQTAGDEPPMNTDRTG